MLMGSKEIIRRFICVISCVFFMFPFVQGQQELYQARNSLDSFIHKSALNRAGKTLTGTLYEIPLPSNFSGISASFLRLRSSRLWLAGANFSFFSIPPRTLPWPFSIRIRIVYENLGNWSSTYYDVPNYTFISPVIGLLAYDASNVTENNPGIVEFRNIKDPIFIHFPNTSLMGQVNTTGVQCVRFKANGEVEFSNLTAMYSCIASGHGHFALVIPTIPIPPVSRKHNRRLWRWWVIGLVVGFVALILLIGLGIFVLRCLGMKRIWRMQKESERGEALGTVWVGTSRMPLASAIRTQPTIENSYVP